MGLFDFPRIHVWGTQRCNPATGNNNSMSPGTEGAITADSEKVRAVTQGMTDADFARWMESMGPSGGPTSGWLNSQWNYYGDMSFRFIDVRVRAVQLGYDEFVADDPLLGAQVYLNDGVMCDANPEGYDSTQIFAEALEIRAPGALGGSGTFLSRKPSRATTRWLNWYRNINFHGNAFPNSSGGAGGASATFQCAIPFEAGDLLPATRNDPEFDEILHRFLPRAESPGAMALAEVFKPPSRALGLIFRYNLYLTYPRITDNDLAARFQAGERPDNPAIGLILGTIAPWYPGETRTITMGRFLRPAQSYPNPYRTGGATPSKPYYLSPCVAKVDRAAARVSIDAANCLPEIGSEGMKYSLGTVTLGLRQATAAGQDPAKNPAPISTLGTIRNDRETYQQRGGIYDIDCSGLAADVRAALDDDGYELVLTSSDSGVLLYEPEYMVASDSECSYLDEPPASPLGADRDFEVDPVRAQIDALCGSIPLSVRRRGSIPPGPIPLRIEQWQFTPTGDVGNLGYYYYPILLDAETFEVADGLANYPLRPKGGPGVFYYRLVAPGQWPSVIDAATFASQSFAENLSILRVLPYEDDLAVAKTDDELDFDLIYKEIFRYYKLIFPAMSRRLDMADAAIWRSPTAAQYVLRMINPELWETFNYMPRTRDLSASRARLLTRYCNKVIGLATADPSAPIPSHPAPKLKLPAAR